MEEATALHRVVVESPEKLAYCAAWCCVKVYRVAEDSGNMDKKVVDKEG